MAKVLAPRVLDELHRLIVDMSSYESWVTKRALALIGYQVRPSPEKEAADALIHMLAREAVRAVKEQYATGPDFDDEEDTG